MDAPTKGLFIGHDLGTGGNKAVLMDAEGCVLATALASYSPSYPREGWVEQNPEEWWAAVVLATRELLKQANVEKGQVRAIAFAGQMLSLVPMQSANEPSRPAIVWMDARAGREASRLVRRCGGERILRTLAGALPTGKDIVAKLLWIRDNEPGTFARTRAFCDATGYLVARATGELVMDRTGASGTGILIPGTGEWSRVLGTLALFPFEKMPRVRLSTEALPLSLDAADALGLVAGTKVMVGLSDIPSAAIGAGAVEDGDAHLYLGTSAWVAVTSKRKLTDAKRGIASIASADPPFSLGIGECETAGACVDWFIARFCGASNDAEPLPLFDGLVSASEPGASGLLFAPWMHGERAPVPDSTLRGAYLNVSFAHEPKHFARAIVEGVALNLRWVLSGFEGLGARTRSLRALGGGAASDAWLQIIADVTGRTIERVVHPRFAGAKGAALTAAIGAGAFSSFRDTKRVVHVERSFVPSSAAAKTYDRLFESLKAAYPALSAIGRTMAPLGSARI